MVKRHNMEAVLASVPTLIHDVTHRSRWHRKLARDLATALFWAAWIYWMLPLLTLVAWIFGLHVAYLEFAGRYNLANLAYILPRYALVVLVIALASVNWAGLQIWLRRGNERRRPIPESSLLDVAQFFRIPPPELRAAHAARIVVARHDANGGVRDFTSHAPRRSARPG